MTTSTRRKHSIGNIATPIFPLKVTPFEWLMIRDDRPDYPMVAEVELDLSGEVDREKMAFAVRNAAARNPLLNARLKKHRFSRPCWVNANTPTEIRWESLAENNGCAPIDIRTGAGLRVVAQTGDKTLRLRLQIHHACCDGIGAFQFLEDVFAAYANEVSGDDTVNARPLDRNALLSRGRLAWNSHGLSQWFRNVIFGIQQTWNFSTSTPATIDSTGNAQLKNDCNNAAQLKWIDDIGLLPRLRRAAAEKQVTLNDILLRDWFLTINSWTTSHGGNSRDALLRMLMPCNLRGAEHDELAAANVMGYSFLNRRQSDCDEPDELLRGIKMETEFIRKRNASLIFIRTIAAASVFPFGQYLMPTSDRCLATALLSNVGDPTQLFNSSFPRQRGRLIVGNLVLEQIAAWSPLRRQTRAGIVACTYANRLSIGLKCDGMTLSSADAAELLNTFLSHLEKSAAANEPATCSRRGDRT